MVVESQADAAPTRWVFIPSKYRDDCRWIEVGRDVTTGADGTTVRVDRPYLTDLMVESEELHLYHFHPLSTRSVTFNAARRKSYATCAGYRGAAVRFPMKPS